MEEGSSSSSVVMEEEDAMEVDKKKRKEQSKKKVSTTQLTTQCYRGKLVLDNDAPSPASLQCTRSCAKCDSAAIQPRGDTPFRYIKETPLPIQLPSEIQTISFKQNKLGIVDATGTVTLCQPSEDFSIESSKCSSFKISSKLERGWNGIDFNTSKDQVLVASMMGKSVSIYDVQTQQMSSQFHVPMYPTQAQFITLNNSQEPVLAITEYNHLTLWDLRSPNSCIKRLQVSPSALYALAYNDNDVIATAGAARTIHSYDCKKWSLCGTWVNCLKYEATSLHFSKASPSLIYVGGMDSGLACGEWKSNSGNATYNNFLGDSRWLGLAKASDRETFVGFTEASTLFVVQYKEDEMRQASSSKEKKTKLHFSPPDTKKHKKPKKDEI